MKVSLLASTILNPVLPTTGTVPLTQQLTVYHSTHQDYYSDIFHCIILIQWQVKTRTSLCLGQSMFTESLSLMESLKVSERVLKSFLGEQRVRGTELSVLWSYR